MRYFDILPGSKPLKIHRKKSGEFIYFFFVSLGVFTLMMAGAFVVRGKLWVSDSLPAAKAGAESLISAAKSLTQKDPKETQILFQKAGRAFEELQGSMGFLATQGKEGIRGGIYLEASQKLLSAVQKITELGQEFSSFSLNTDHLPTLEEIRSYNAAAGKLLEKVTSIQQDIAQVSPRALPSPWRPKLIEVQKALGEVLAALIEVKGGLETALKFLGDKAPHHFLILLQNTAERRASGGFIGSYILAETNDGKIVKMELKDVYESDGQLSVNVEPPAGIREVADRYAMRDANYSPDFETSAKQILWFLEHSKGPSVDTVVAVNEKMVSALLGVTGPIEIPNLSLTLDADHFALMLSYLVEAKISGENAPKKVMAELLPVLQEKFIQAITPQKAVELANEWIQSQDLLIYSQDPEIQKTVTQWHLEGSMTASVPKTDFLQVVSTSIGGNKSDAFVKMKLRHETAVSYEGRLLSTVEIQKTHTWNDSIFETLRPLISRFGTGPYDENTLKFILGAGPNVDYMRVYLPKGSVLVGVEGVSESEAVLSEDLGYTMVGFKFKPVAPGASESVRLTYELPFSLSLENLDHYRLIVGAQPGADQVELEKTFVLEEGVKVIQNYPPSSSAFSLTPDFKTALDHNQFFITSLKAL